MKKGLQFILAILSMIPILIGLLGITQGTTRWLPAGSITPDFDTHYRYITGYYLSLGMLGFWMIPKIEQHTGLFRIICASVFMGGVGRVFSIIQVGMPNLLALMFTGLELCFPLLLLWQAKISRKRQHD
ncbi:MAG: hypothetical protein RLZZ381_1203 [Cyanobacteriota bacterium]|jgi:hypothetical protein